MARTTFSISYYCRASKVNKDNQAPLELCININQQRLFLNLPTKFNPKDFNKKRKPQFIEDILMQYRIRINEVMADIMANNLPITANILREYLRTGGTKSKTLEDLCNDYLHVIKPRIGKSMTQPVYKKYELVCDFLYDTFGKEKEVCSFNNGDMVRAYDKLKDKFLPSTSAGYMTKIKTIFTYAIDNGHLKINPFNGIKVDKGEPKVEFLTYQDIQAIKNLDIVDYPRLEKVRDLLLFQTSIGTAYCDLVAFDKENLKEVNGVYVYSGKRQKTNISFTAVVLPDGIKVLEKYDYKLPLISNQKYNAYLKELQKLAGIKTTITTHLCRKSYAHFLLNNGVRIELVAKSLGHSNVTITQKCYCKPTEETIINEVGNILKEKVS